MDFIKKSADFDLIGFGEVMLRLSPPDKEKISQSEIFEKNCGDSEFNSSLCSRHIANPP